MYLTAERGMRMKQYKRCWALSFCMLILAVLLFVTVPAKAEGEPLLFDAETGTLTATETEVSDFEGFKQAVLEAKAYTESLSEGETPQLLSIVLKADISLTEMLSPENNAFVLLAKGERLEIRSAQGEHFTISAPAIPGGAGSATYKVFCGKEGGQHFTLKDIRLETGDFVCTGVDLYDYPSPGQWGTRLDYLEEPDCYLTIERCEFRAAKDGTFCYGVIGGHCAIDVSNFDLSESSIRYGGIFTSGSTVKISDSTFRGNTVFGSNVRVGNSKLTMSNCTFSGTDYSGSLLMVILVRPSAFSAFGSVIDVSDCVFENNRGVIGAAINANESTGTVSDSTFTGNVCELDGTRGDGAGAIRLQSHTALTLENCTVTGNRSDLSGGAIMLFIDCNLTVKGGTISNNTAATHGGAICVADAFSADTTTASVIVLDGVTLSGNTANCESANDGQNHAADGYAPGGGAVFIHENCGITLKGGTVISENKTENDGNGGGIYVCFGGMVDMQDAVIENNIAAGNGGGIYLDGAGSYEGITHSNPGTTDDGFGSGSNMIMTDGRVSGNSAVKGGGIYIDGNNTANGTEYTGGTLAMNGGVITANHASGYGGGVYLAAAETGETAAGFVMNDGAVYFNISGADGNTDPGGAGAEIYSEGGNTKLSVNTAQSITEYIQNEANAYVPGRDREVWFLDWFEDFSTSRYMTEQVLERVVYPPAAEDGQTRALILDRSTELSVTKQVSGETAPESGTFGFELTLDNLPQDERYPVEITKADGTKVSSEEAVRGGKLGFTLDIGETFRIGGLPAGAEFTLTETDRCGAERFETACSALETSETGTWSFSGKTNSTWQGSADATVKGEVIWTNVYPTPERIDVTVKKVWDDGDDRDGIRPASVTVQLYADGRETEAAVTLDASNNWKHTWSGLLKYADDREIVYTVKETATPEGYAAEVSGDTEAGFTVTNVHRPEETEITVKKVWDDDNDCDGVRPDRITVHLFADSTEVKSASVTPDENGDWSYMFTGLPKYRDGGVEIVYTIEEESVEQYETSVSGTTITNKHVPERTTVEGKKTWDDNDDFDELRPASITIRLFADGTEIDSRVVTEDDNWKWVFSDLPKYREGREIRYTIKEDRVRGYTATVDGYNVTNVYAPPTGDTARPAVWIALLALSLAAGIALLITERMYARIR